MSFGGSYLGQKLDKAAMFGDCDSDNEIDVTSGK